MIFLAKNCVMLLASLCCFANENLCYGVKLYLGVFRGELQSHNYSWKTNWADVSYFYAMFKMKLQDEIATAP